MATQTTQRTTLEKLKQPVEVAGLVAECAEVTRFYYVDTETKAEEEYGAPIVTVLWGATVADKIAELDRRKTEVAELAAAEAVSLDELKAGLERDTTGKDESDTAATKVL